MTATEGSQRGLGPVWTLPNVVTYLRLACIPVFAVLVIGADDRFAAAILLAVLGATDWVDGWLARRFDQGTDLGRVLDPTADRLLFLVAIAVMIADGSVPVWFAVAVLVRECLVAGGVLALAALGADDGIVEVTWWGKTGTFGLMFAFPMFLMSHADVAGARGFEVAAWVFGLPSLVISWYAAFAYIPQARRALSELRAARGH